MDDTTKFQISKKFFDGTIIVVGGSTLEEFSDNFDGMEAFVASRGLPYSMTVEHQEPDKKDAPRDDRPKAERKPNSTPQFDYTKPVPAEFLPPELNDGGEYYLEKFDRVEVIPELDDRVTLEFYSHHLQYPVGVSPKWPAEKAEQLMAPYGDKFDAFKRARLNIDGNVYWAYGKSRGEGKARYKDVRFVERPA